ncbi:MAG TPA: patatin-like phospholipase family protein [Pirellulales bacterium]|jgi:NTE family protein|nr:patatin-like phospholipase family protein [Pirellulales bacterium]HEX4143675.1 patatin-like phospholipase family protein [Pirellulales bacterium]
MAKNSSDPFSAREPLLALALGGGGARAAYQVGVLRGIAARFPEFHAPLLTGVSAGAINVSHLANHLGSFQQKVDDLTRLWQQLDFDDVFKVNALGLVWRVIRVGLRLSVGMPPGIPRPYSMVDTQPLRAFLKLHLPAESGRLDGIAQNIASGNLEAVALTALNYASGETITFVDGKAIDNWERPLRRGVRTELTIEHIMASAALPLLFSPVCIHGEWYGDGGIRLVAPLSPAVHLGADRMLVLSTHYAFPHDAARRSKCEGPPSPAVILGALYDAVFLDHLDQDAMQLDRINGLLHRLRPEDRNGLREVQTVVIRPSADLGEMAAKFERELPRTFRYFMRRFGSHETKEQDLISTVMFHRDYIGQLLELGERDALLHADTIAQLLAK